MANITELSKEELEKKINSAKVAVERNVGAIKTASENKLAKLEAELATRVDAVKKDVKEDVKAVKKEADKYWMALDALGKEWGVFKAKNEEEADEYVMDNFGEIDDRDVKEITKAQHDNWGKRKKTTAKPAAKKVAAKKTVTPKKVAKKPTLSSTEKFELTIDGKVFKFSDLASKEACQRANDAVKARYKEVTEHKAATKDGIERASTIPVTQRISDGFASIAKKAVSEVPVTKINKKPEDVKREIQAVETAFDNLFDKLGDLMGKQIPKSQRKEIMAILTKFEEKVDKGSTKKDVATSKVRKKEDGGMAGSGVDMFGAGNAWSYASLM